MMNHHHHFHESSTLPRRTAENARSVFFIILLIFPLSESRKNIWECLRPSVWECNWGLFLNLSASNFSHETSIKPCAKTFTTYGVSTCWLLICPVVYQRMCAWGIHSPWTSGEDRCFTAATMEFQQLRTYLDHRRMESLLLVLTYSA